MPRSKTYVYTPGLLHVVLKQRGCQVHLHKQHANNPPFAELEPKRDTHLHVYRKVYLKRDTCIEFVFCFVRPFICDKEFPFCFSFLIYTYTIHVSYQWLYILTLGFETPKWPPLFP